MSSKTILSPADQQLLRTLATLESELPEELGSEELESRDAAVQELRSLAPRAAHERLITRAHDLIALLSPEPCFGDDLRGLTTRSPAFVVPLAASARRKEPVSGPPLGVWAGGQRPAMAEGAWVYAEQELKDLVGLTAAPIEVSAKSGPLALPYQPLAKTSSLSRLVRPDLPSVAVTPVPPVLRAAAEDSARSLERYARTLETFEEVNFAIRAARVPLELFALWMQREEGLALRQQVRTLSAGDSMEMKDLLAVVLPNVEAPDRRHIAAVSELLQRFEIGFEPDPRFLAPLPHPETRLTFITWRLDRDKPSPEFVTAAGVMHIGFAMAAADGEVDQSEIDHIRDRALSLVTHEDERSRLTLRVTDLSASPPDFERLLLRLKGLRPAAKEVIADLLVSVASTDGHVSAMEYEALQLAYRSMRLGKSALDQTLEELRGDVRLAEAVGAASDRRSRVGQEKDAKQFDALRDLLLGAPVASGE